jgi:hypothetical protein
MYWLLIPDNITRPVYFDFSREVPEASVNLIGHQWIYSTHGSQRSTVQTQRTVLSPGFVYDIDVHITMSDSVIHDQSGMIVIDAKASKDTTYMRSDIAHSIRPVVIGKTPWVSMYAKQLFLLVPTALGLNPMETTISTRIFEVIK